MSNERFKPYNLSQHKNDNFHDDDDENSLIIPFNNGGKIGEQTKFDSELKGKEKEQHHDDLRPMDRQKRDLEVVKDLLKEAQMMIDLPEEIILNSVEKVGQYSIINITQCDYLSIENNLYPHVFFLSSQFRARPLYAPTISSDKCYSKFWQFSSIGCLDPPSPINLDNMRTESKFG